MPIFLNTGMQYQNSTLSSKLVYQPLTNFKLYYHCGMLTLYDIKFSDVIFTWRHIKYDVTLDQNIIEIDLEVWKWQVKQHNWYLLR